MLILDLDDTIFQTSSLDPKHVESNIRVLLDYYEKHNPKIIKSLKSDLWTMPIDVVLNKYRVPDELARAFYDSFKYLDYRKIDIQTFEDYHVLKALQKPKILVTTGIKELQMTKIWALGIQNDFESIHIDDPRENPRRTKHLIFQSILNSRQVKPKDIVVIGDNPDSELKAANNLKMTTIQRRSSSKLEAPFVDYIIDNFNEILSIFP